MLLLPLLFLLFWPIVLPTTGKPVLFSLKKDMYYIWRLTVSPTCFSYVEEFFRSFRKLCFLNHLALISLLWTLSICFLSFLNCSTQIYTQHCSWIVSPAECSCQLLLCWRKLYLVTRTWYLALLIQRAVTPRQQSLLEGEGLLSWITDFR